MTKRQTAIIIVFGVVVLAGVVLGIAFRKSATGPAGMIPSPSASSPSSTPPNSGVSPAQPYSSEVPANAAPTVPDKSIPIVNQPGVAPGAKFGSFQIVASRSGYSPETITVNKGDTVEIDLSADGGSYDIFSSSAGFYASASPSKTGKVSFLAGTPGTFLFTCRDLCPSGKTISGQLIVLP